MYTDYPYIVIYAILIICAFHYWKYENKIAVYVSMISVFLFFALRAPVVGADTWNYVRYLAGTRDFYSEWDDRALEILFVGYRHVINSLTSSYAVIMFINTVISIGPLYYLIKRYSCNVPLSLLMFFNLNCLILYFVGLRQIIALAFLVSTVIYCLEKKTSCFKTCLLFLAAGAVSFGFHVTGLIYAIFYLAAFLIPVKKRWIFLASVIVSALVGLFADKFNVLEFLSSISSMNLLVLQRVDAYLVGDDLNELHAMSIALRPSFLGLVIYSFIQEEKLNHPFSKIFLFGIIMYNFGATIPMIHRMVLPLIMFGCVIFTWCFSNDLVMSIKKQRVLQILTLLIVIYFSRSWYIRCSEWTWFDESCMHPYQFIFEDYD